MPTAQLVGIDVSAKTLRLCLQTSTGSVESLELPNSAEGHRQLCRKITQRGRRARVGLEATGPYSLDLALALTRQPRVEVMVINPRAVRDFARACLQRSKTDALDAQTLLEFVRRMPFQPWQPPSAERLELRALARRMAALTVTCTQEKNRLHAASSSAVLGAALRQDLEISIEHLERRIDWLLQQALALIDQCTPLKTAFEILTSIKGFADKSGVQVLAELAVLPQDMTARQWVAHAGIDPRHQESGTSLHRPARISRTGNRYLRAALYMPALVAIQRDRHVKAFYDQLLARGKAPMQANVAVMRKLLHALNAMLRAGTRFESHKFRLLEGVGA
ncbi:MAG TPA: IS110 family transposase [Thermoanaerobaculia bacterium]|jgi:transposase